MARDQEGVVVQVVKDREFLRLEAVLVLQRNFELLGAYKFALVFVLVLVHHLLVFK